MSVCLDCGAEIARKPAESPGRWKKRQHCDRGCAIRAALKKPEVIENRRRGAIARAAAERPMRSIRQRERMADPDNRARLAESQRRRWAERLSDPEEPERAREAAARLKTPENRARMGKALSRSLRAWVPGGLWEDWQRLQRLGYTKASALPLLEDLAKAEGKRMFREARQAMRAKHEREQRDAY